MQEHCPSLGARLGLRGSLCRAEPPFKRQIPHWVPCLARVWHTPISPCVSTGCLAVTGPHTMRGYVGGSLLVNCRYEAGQEMQPKFWCYPGRIFTCSDDIIITSSEHPMVRVHRFSIQDNRTRRVFTVTMESLTEGDAGTYVCGVRTGTFNIDEGHVVKVIVDPGQSLHLSAPPQHSTSAQVGLIPALTLPPSIPPPTAAGTDAPRGTPGSFRYFPVLAGLQVLALLAMSGAVLWASLRG
uniref:Immunoglobulin domain-containing protein n=1 Tax=Athene cunicularia TaxID=194338 RepID=A0A663LSR0_ATHCN